MDIYLPADFHALRDDAAGDDWRDAPTAWAREYPLADAPHGNEERERINRCADPSWRVF